MTIYLPIYRIYRMLILDSIDKAILATLTKRATHASEISRLLDIPRTTISFRLNRLKNYHKVTDSVVGRKTHWHIEQERIHNKSYYRIFKGDEFLECYSMIETLSEKSIIYVVQGKKAAEAEFEHVPRQLMEKIHKIIKRRRIIMRAIANKEILAKVASLDVALKKSHMGRPQSVKLVETAFTSSGELFIAKEYLSIINPKKKSGIIVKDPEIVTLVYDFAKIFFDLADRLESVDLNSFIKKSL